MSDDSRIIARLTQVADQLVELVNELLALAGRPPVGPGTAPPESPEFRAEMRRFSANGESVDLSETEALVLEKLLECKCQLVTKNELCILLGLDGERQERNLKSYVYRLRNKLGRMARPGIRIEPVHGAGYILSDAV